MICWTDARNAFGEDGFSGLKSLLNSVREFFRAIPPDQMSTTFVFIYRMRNDDLDKSQCEMDRMGTALSVQNLSGHRRRIEDAPAILIVVRDDGGYDLIAPETLPSLEMLSERSLVFVNEGGIDRFIIGGRSITMPQLATGAASNFAVATVTDLEEALERYRRDAAEVSCPILQEIWVGGRNGHRLVFRNKPEATMRRSLERFLNTRIRGDVSVRSEHNTDETKPVDLIVNWFGSKLRGLIEIKWLGDSLTKDSDGTQFTSYREARAQEGADQLADYIDRERSTDSTAVLRGYLVVFDGRRLRVKNPTTAITSKNALYYRNRDIALTRDYSAERSDIAPLIRYFLEPRSSLLAPPSESV